MIKISLFLIFILFVGMQSAFSYEPILITKSHFGDSLTLDGKWSYPSEWKPSSLEKIRYDDNTEHFLNSQQWFL